MSSSSSSVQRPLVIKETQTKPITVEAAQTAMQAFLNTEAGVQAAPTGLVQQLIQFQASLENK
ncbi:hypothetical protein IWW49_003216 [Coemansia sp. RSA 1797]|nr:hypothetical protein IWW49_003216 [Coemansia sp. RSA 1797]